MVENYNSMDLAAFKNVWVFCEQRQGKMMPTTFELISEGRKLADELGVNLCGLLLGDNVEGIAKELGGYGADEVIVCEHPLLKNYTTDAYAKVICDVISEMKPEAFLIGATNIGRDLGPRCAARLHTGLCADCTHLDVDMPIYKDFLRSASTLPEEKIEKMNTAKVMGQDHDVSRVRRQPDGHHHLPALPSRHGDRSPRRDEEGSLRSGQGGRGEDHQAQLHPERGRYGHRGRRGRQGREEAR